MLALPFNMVTCVALAILVISMIAGLAMGMVRTIFSMFTVIIVMIAATFGGPQLSKVIQTTWLGDQVRITIEETIFNNIDEEVGELLDVDSVLDSMNLPPMIRDTIESKTGVGEAASMEYDQVKYTVSSYLTGIILNGVCFVLIAFAVWVLLTVLMIALDLAAKLPVLHTLNHFGGLLIGAVRGYFIIWILFVAITVLSSTGIGANLYAQINESPILTMLFNTNLPMRIMNTFFR